MTEYNVFTGHPLPDPTNSEYIALARVLLGREPEEGPLPTVRIDYEKCSKALPDCVVCDPPAPNIWDLSDEDDQALCIAVCSHVVGMTADTWSKLSEAERLPWMKQTAAVVHGEITAESEVWLTLAQVARGLDLHSGRRPDSKQVSRLGLDDNGQRGRDRRIRRASVMEYCRHRGLPWNETAAMER